MKQCFKGYKNHDPHKEGHQRLNIQVPGDQQPAVHGEPEQHAEEGEADGRRGLDPLLPPRLASGFHVQVS